MARLNNIIKFIMLNVNIFFSTIGTFFLGLAIYLWAANWGSLDKNFFMSAALIILFLGVCMFLTACMGCQSINNQTRIYIIAGCLSGRKLTFLHLCLLILGFVGEIYILMQALTASSEYATVYDTLSANANSNPSYVIYESIVASKFNEFFFGATSECKTSLYTWFWTWVNSNCPSTLSQSSCQGCNDYSLTFCEAYEGYCNENNYSNNQYCPYTICRAGISHYFQLRIEPIAYTLLALTFAQAILIFLDIMLLCYHPHDSYEVIQLKRGLLANEQPSNTSGSGSRGTNHRYNRVPTSV